MTTMNVVKGKGPIFDPGLCRCCGSMKRCRVLTVEYECMGQKETYADMLIDCFGIMMSHLDGKPSSRLVCATCVSRLREAAAFREQVLRCEAAFLQVRMCDGEAEDNLDTWAKLEGEIKVEPQDGDSVSPGAPPSPYDAEDRASAHVVENAEGERPNNQARLVTSEKLEGDIKVEPRDGDSVSPGDPPSPGDAEDLASHELTSHEVENAEAKRESIEDEPRMTTEEVAELKKHRANIRAVLECSNATPIKCFSGVQYKCCYCKDKYLNPEDLKAHTLNQHDEKTRKVYMQRNFLSAFLVRLDITRLKCQLCDSAMDSVEVLTEHLRSEHGKKVHTDVRSHVLPFKFDDGLKCVVCAKIFTKFRSLQEHMSVHFRNYLCDACDAGFPTKKMLLQHMNVHKTGIFNCDICSKSFSTQQNLKVHERYAHRKSNFLNKCGVCGDRFKCYRVKEKHMLIVHGLSSAVKCQACEKVFKNQRQLSIHVKRDHLMHRPHKCPQCEMAFYERKELKNHLVKHTGLREFRCEVCHKAYGLKKTLREHMRIHLADRRFRCQHCGQGFVQKCSWRGHMRSKHNELLAF